MEPVNCTAHVRGDSCELWAPTQIPAAAAASVASALGIPRENIKVHVTFIGGGFGRRLIQDYAVEAALISRDAGAPVQVVWSREDDIRHDFYRPAACHILQAGLDARGQLISWRHRGSSPSIETFYNGTGISPSAAAQVDSLDFPALFVPNFRLEFTVAESGMPLGYWRSVDSSGNQFALSSFFDEAAHAAGRDPLEFLLAAFGPARKIPLRNNETLDVGRRRAVVELAAEKSDWQKPLAPGRGRGIAASFGWGSYVAHIAEVTCDAKTGAVHVDRMVCAIDCGTAINPLGVKAQMEGAINFGLAQTLKSAITVEAGRVQQSNFHDYEVLRMNDAPLISRSTLCRARNRPAAAASPEFPPWPLQSATPSSPHSEKEFADFPFARLIWSSSEKTRPPGRTTIPSFFWTLSQVCRTAQTGSLGLVSLTARCCFGSDLGFDSFLLVRDFRQHTRNQAFHL